MEGPLGRHTIKIYTGEADLINAPPTSNILPWWKFNSDFYASDRDFDDVEEIAEIFSNRKIDLRPYMIEEPYMINTTDKLDKVLDMMRHFHLRALPVVDPNDGTPVAVLTRGDLFAYMSL